MGFAPQINIYQVRLFHTTDGIEHKHQFFGNPVDFAKAPGDIAANYGMYDKAANPITFPAAADAFWGAVDDFYSAADTVFGRAELWKTAADTQNWSFLAAHTTAVVSANPGAYTSAAEFIMTFRTVGGHTMRCQLEEPVGTPAVPLAVVPNPVGTITERLAAHYLDSGTVYCDRFGDFPFAVMRWFKGQNEHIFKVRYGRV